MGLDPSPPPLVMSQQAMRHSYDVTDSYTWRDSFTCAPWLITGDSLSDCLSTVNSNKAWVNRQWGNDSTVMSHGAHVNASRHVYEWVTSRTRMSHVTYTSMAAIKKAMRHGAHVNESRHVHEWVTSHIWMRHVTHHSSGLLEGQSHRSHQKGNRTAVCTNHVHTRWKIFSNVRSIVHLHSQCGSEPILRNSKGKSSKHLHESLTRKVIVFFKIPLYSPFI